MGKKSRFKPDAVIAPISEHKETLRAMEDNTVVQMFLDGHEHAFEELVNRYSTRLLNFVYRTVGDLERGQDLIQ